jgi:glucose-6-phosphate isomerase
VTESAQPRHRWLVGSRRAWTTSQALARWARDRGVTGAVWTPASYELTDLAESLERLIEAGARPDAELLWDFAIEDIRSAAGALRGVYAGAEQPDGYVCVWIDPARANDAGRAVAWVRELAGDVRMPNIACGLAWSGNRASIVEGLVAGGVPVALSGVRDAGAAVAAARDRGMERRRKEAEEGAEVLEIPVFVLGGSGPGDQDHVVGIELITEFQLFGLAGTPRLPLSPDAEQSGLSAAVERLAQRAKEPATDDDYAPISFVRGVIIECNELHKDEVLEDIWDRDHEVWKDDPTEISNRLGWLDIAERRRSEVGELTEFAKKTRSGGDLKHVVLCGMGGSSLAPQTFHSVLSGGIPFTVLDTTHPDHIASVRDSLDLERTLFVISSKSGTTVETRALFEYFWSLVSRGERFVAITDPGSELASVAKERAFLRVFEDDPNIGGRYSGLSYFGLVPAALAGVDVESIVSSARRAMVANAPGVAAPDAPAMRLAAALGEAALKESRDKLTFVLPPRLASLGDWIEQLVAESTGKEGNGILPVVGERLGPPAAYGPDRVFCVYTIGSEAPPAELEAIEADHPVVRIRLSDVKTLGAELFRWGLATAVVGYELDINPFDQPDVEAAKEKAREALQGSGTRPDPGSAKDLLQAIEPPRYIAIQAFVAPTEENARRLDAVRTKLRDKHKVAVTVGFGPRFLHSTGQLHKGGPPTGVFIQVTDKHNADIEIPTMGFSFGRLIDAQADGDLQVLRDAGRPVARVSLDAIEEITL